MLLVTSSSKRNVLSRITGDPGWLLAQPHIKTPGFFPSLLCTLAVLLSLEMCGKRHTKVVVALTSIHIIRKSYSVHPEAFSWSQEDLRACISAEFTGSASAAGITDAAGSRGARRDLEGRGHLRVTHNLHVLHTLSLGIQHWDLLTPYPPKGMMPFLVCETLLDRNTSTYNTNNPSGWCTSFFEKFCVWLSEMGPDEVPDFYFSLFPDCRNISTTPPSATPHFFLTEDIW